MKTLAFALTLLAYGAVQAASQWTGFFNVTGLYLSSAENFP